MVSVRAGSKCVVNRPGKTWLPPSDRGTTASSDGEAIGREVAGDGVAAGIEDVVGTRTAEVDGAGGAAGAVSLAQAAVRIIVTTISAIGTRFWAQRGMGDLLSSKKGLRAAEEPRRWVRARDAGT
jgi:hypothetical protein